MPYRKDGDWAQQIPYPKQQGPYRDYGWEAGESALPEFRDPDVHRMPYEEDWTPYKGQSRRGPHVGKGPKGYTRSDDRIFDDVCAMLTQHGYIDASHMEVFVENGEVTLKGMVDDRRMKRMAEDMIDEVPGVQDVHNELRIRQPSGQ